MADRRRRELADCLAVAQARRALAEREHAHARVEEDAASSRAQEAKEALSAAAAAWETRIGSDFDPIIGDLFARDLVGSADQATRAYDGLRVATATMTRRRSDWQEQDARCRQTDDLVREHHRRLVTLAEERQLAAQADRLSFAWRRP